MIEWFDDLVLGMRFKSPEKRVTREDIKRFASEFDPQAYHLDEAAAERSVFGGLVASGWHTAAIAMRLAVETRPFGPHPLLGLGVDELRWLAPVRPDDVDPSGRRGRRAHAVAVKAARDRPGQMDGVQSARGAGLHVQPDRHRAPPARLIDPGVALDRGRKCTPAHCVQFCTRLNLFSRLASFFCNSKRLKHSSV